MPLKTLLNDWRLLRLRDPPLPSATHRLIHELDIQSVSVTEPRRADLEEARRYLVDFPVERLPQADARQLRLVPWLLFAAGPKGEPKLADVPGFWPAYSYWLKTARSGRTIKHLLHAYLLWYPHAHPVGGNLADTLIEIFRSEQSGSLQRLRQWSADWRLLEKDGPTQFFRAWKAHEDPPGANGNGFLAQVGFGEGLSKGEFVRASYRAGMSAIRKQLIEELPTPQAVDKLFDLLTDGGGQDHRARYGGEEHHLLNALLEPWADGGIPANSRTEPIRERLQDHLMRRFSQPGVDPVWGKASDTARQVMSRWVVRQTLDAFFEILRHTAAEQWTYRQKFWTAYYEDGAISDAWLVLGNEARSLARRSEQSMNFGQLRGASGDQSVLMLRIGDYLFVEWSHSGKCWAYAERAMEWPRMAHKEELRGGGEIIKPQLGEPGIIHYPHAGMERWQLHLARFIYQRTRFGHPELGTRRR